MLMLTMAMVVIVIMRKVELNQNFPALEDLSLPSPPLSWKARAHG